MYIVLCVLMYIKEGHLNENSTQVNIFLIELTSPASSPGGMVTVRRYVGDFSSGQQQVAQSGGQEGKRKECHLVQEDDQSKFKVYLAGWSVHSGQGLYWLGLDNLLMSHTSLTVLYCTVVQFTGL